MQKVADEIEHKLKKLVDEKQINIFKTNKGVEIEIKSNILFESGQAVIQKAARSVLKEISAVLENMDAPINVEGFTDNIPINTLIFPSNWELSAARAANVVHLFSKTGIKPERLSAIGYGEFKPLESNDTAKGRERNRRINIVVLNRKEADRRRMPELDGKKKQGTGQSKIGDSIQGVIDINVMDKVLQLDEIDKLVNTPQESVDNRSLPTIINIGSTKTSNNAVSPSSVKNKSQSVKPLLLPPPKLLPIGERTGN
jgi:outer membrane protein OmpA-like peptidoglycan-associated protein